MVTFTINIPPMLAYIPYMDPMGFNINELLLPTSPPSFHLLKGQGQEKSVDKRSFLMLLRRVTETCKHHMVDSPFGKSIITESAKTGINYNYNMICPCSDHIRSPVLATPTPPIDLHLQSSNLI
jgi:hypothetical protein